MVFSIKKTKKKHSKKKKIKITKTIKTKQIKNLKKANKYNIVYLKNARHPKLKANTKNTNPKIQKLNAKRKTQKIKSVYR